MRAFKIALAIFLGISVLVAWPFFVQWPHWVEYPLNLLMGFFLGRFTSKYFGFFK